MALGRINLDGAPEICKCGCIEFQYLGLGEYRCYKCGRIMGDNFSKVRAYVEEHPNVSVTEVAEQTGVDEEIIARFVNEKRLAATVDPRLDIRCKKCGDKILIGNYCEKCESQRQQHLSDMMSSALGRKTADDKPARKFSATVGKSDQGGKMRFSR